MFTKCIIIVIETAGPRCRRDTVRNGRCGSRRDREKRQRTFEITATVSYDKRHNDDRYYVKY